MTVPASTVSEIWTEVDIENWRDYEDAISDNPTRLWLYRGHSDVTCKLESSFYRSFDEIHEIAQTCKPRRFSRDIWRDEYENELVNTFKAHAHLFFAILPKPSKKLEWLSIMQHYGTPTRLLDWTFSPYIAAYFALEYGDDDCCVYAIKHSEFTDIDEDVLGDSYKKRVFENQTGEKSFMFPYEPEMRNERIVCQQGVFLVPSTNYETFDQIISQYKIGTNICFKYIFKKTIRLLALKKLMLMNISAASLFPGIDGFCRSLKFHMFEPSSKLKRLC